MAIQITILHSNEFENFRFNERKRPYEGKNDLVIEIFEIL